MFVRTSVSLWQAWRQGWQAWLRQLSLQEQPLEPTEAGRQTVSMGTAVVLEDVCYSYAGRTCGVCYRACPLPGKAMKLGLYETPIVNPEHCVGCGLCEQACVHMPQAIRIIPASQLAKEEVHG